MQPIILLYLLYLSIIFLDLIVIMTKWCLICGNVEHITGATIHKYLFLNYFDYFICNSEKYIFAFRLPSEPNRRKLWMKYVQEHRAYTKSFSATSCICMRHFDPKIDFRQTLGGKRTCLTKNAVPSLVSPILEINI